MVNMNIQNMKARGLIQINKETKKVNMNIFKTSLGQRHRLLGVELIQIKKTKTRTDKEIMVSMGKTE